MSKMRCWRRPHWTTPTKRDSFSLGPLLSLGCVALLLACLPARAESPDDEYVRIYKLMEQAEALESGGKSAPALAKYQEVHQALKSFQKVNPNWDAKLVSHRIKSVTEKMQALSQKLAAPPEAVTAGITKIDGKVGASSGATQVKLLEAGAEPRKVMRLHPKAGDKQKLVMTVKQATELSGMPNAAPKMPAMEMTLEATVKSVSADGDIAYDWVLADAAVKEDPDSLPQMLAALKTVLASVKGLSGSGIVSDRGSNSRTDVKLPAGADASTRQVVDQIKEAFAQSLVPLPEEAIGAGAKWQAKSPIKAQGMTLDQTDTYQLASCDGERVSLKDTVAQSATNQKVQNPLMPGLKMDLSKLVGSGTATATLDLTLLYPREITAASRTEMALAVDMGGQKQSMTVKVDTQIRLETK